MALMGASRRTINIPRMALIITWSVWDYIKGDKTLRRPKSENSLIVLLLKGPFFLCLELFTRTCMSGLGR